MTGENFDVYLRPLYNVQKPLGYRSFILRGVLLWTIHDFSWVWYNCRGCALRVCYMPICGPKLRGEHYVELGKQTYTET